MTTVGLEQTQWHLQPHPPERLAGRGKAYLRQAIPLLVFAHKIRDLLPEVPWPRCSLARGQHLNRATSPWSAASLSQGAPEPRDLWDLLPQVPQVPWQALAFPGQH